jgi:UDP-N-acetylglucosamine 2-epimerase (non-hydrolysing)
MIKVLSVFGTRPEAIKMAPVVKELEKHTDSIISKVCVTAQHRAMLDQVLDLFEIRPDYDLNIMKQGQDLFDITCNILMGIKCVFERERPDIVLVHGDTTTTMTASMAAYYCHLKVGHVEAGLRTHNKYAPFPEEINRRVTAALTDIHFAPTLLARNNLLSEGVASDAIHITGNTVIDSLFKVVNKIRNDTTISNKMEQTFSFLDMSKRLILVTGHRRENFGKGFEQICQALAEIADSRNDVEILYPVHLNPQVREPVQQMFGNGMRNNIHLIEPVDYLHFVWLMDRSYLIISDSGGLQEEAPSLGKPVLVMRETTERPEALEAGTVELVGTDPARIVQQSCRLLDDNAAYQSMCQAQNPYGDGHAARRIVEIIKNSHIFI